MEIQREFPSPLTGEGQGGGDVFNVFLHHLGLALVRKKYSPLAKGDSIAAAYPGVSLNEREEAFPCASPPD